MRKPLQILLGTRTNSLTCHACDKLITFHLKISAIFLKQKQLIFILSTTLSIKVGAFRFGISNPGIFTNDWEKQPKEIHVVAYFLRLVLIWSPRSSLSLLSFAKSEVIGASKLFEATEATETIGAIIWEPALTEPPPLQFLLRILFRIQAPPLKPQIHNPLCWLFNTSRSADFYRRKINTRLEIETTKSKIVQVDDQLIYLAFNLSYDLFCLTYWYLSVTSGFIAFYQKSVYISLVRFT